MLKITSTCVKIHMQNLQQDWPFHITIQGTNTQTEEPNIQTRYQKHSTCVTPDSQNEFTPNGVFADYAI